MITPTIKTTTELTTANINTWFMSFVNYIDVKPKSIETYTKAIRQFSKYLQSNGITQPTRQDVINFRESLKDCHKPNTIQLYLTAVKLFFKWLDQEGIYKDVADKVKAPKQDKSHKKSYLTANQCKKLLETANSNKRDYAILVLMLTTGLRTIEVTRANIEDLSVIGNQAVLFIQGKGKDDRGDYVKLDVVVDEAIREYLKDRKSVKNNDPLFTSNSNHKSSNGRLTTRSVSRIAKKYLVNSGFNSDRITAHSLRHTTAHLNLENGATVEETKELLRHSNVATTYIYINEMTREKNNSELRVANAIFSRENREVNNGQQHND